MLKRPLLFLLVLAAFIAPAAAQFPRVDDFSPRRGTPGTQVTITGANLGTVTQVTIGRGSATLLLRSSTRIVVVVGPDATIGPIGVFTRTGQDVTFDSFQVSPRITGFERVLPEPQTPADRIRGVPGNRVAVYGANFSDLNDPQFRLGVLFGGVPAPVEFAAETNLMALIPAGAVTGPITVTNNAGLAVSLGDFYLQPIVTRFSPSRARVGDSVTLTGVSLKGATSVLFGNVPVVPSEVTPTNVVVTVPNIPGDVRLSITSPGGTYLTTSNLVLLPRIDSMQPAGGPPGTVVTLSGSGLAGTLGVEFAGTRVSLLTNTGPATVHAVLPAAATTGPVVLWTAAGTNTTSVPFYVTPTVSSYFPVRALPGTQVTVSGRNFTGATEVTFNGVAAQFTVVDNTRIDAVVPAGAQTGPVRVTHPGGTGTGPAFQVGGLEPLVSSFQPAAGPPGTQVEIVGLNFTGTTSVRFGGVPAAEFSVASDTRLLTRVPPGAATGPVSVTSANGTGQSAAQFFIGTSAELGVTLTRTGAAPGLGQATVVRLDLVNSGPLPAPDALTTVSVADGLAIVSVSPSQGTWEVIGPTATLRWGTVAPGAGVSATIAIEALSVGDLAVEASAGSDAPDLVPQDNEALLVLQVDPPTLSIAPVAGGQVLVRWPRSPEGLVLETTLQPLSGFWLPAGGTPEQADTSWQVRFPASGDARYYRVRLTP